MILSTSNQLLHFIDNFQSNLDTIMPTYDSGTDDSDFSKENRDTNLKTRSKKGRLAIINYSPSNNNGTLGRRKLKDSLTNLCSPHEETSSSLDEDDCGEEWLVSLSPCKRSRSVPGGSIRRTRSNKVVSPVKLKRKSECLDSSISKKKGSPDELERVTDMVEEKIRDISLRTPLSRNRRSTVKEVDEARRSPRSARRSLNYCEVSPKKKRTPQKSGASKDEEEENTRGDISTPNRSVNRAGTPYPPSPLLQDGIREQNKYGLRVSPKVLLQDDDFIYTMKKCGPTTPRTPSTSLRKLVLESRTPTSARKKLIMDEDEVISTPTKTSPTKRKTSGTLKKTPRRETSSKQSVDSPKVGKGFLTPTHTPLKKTHAKLSTIDQAHLKLHLGEVPKSLPCRGEEFNNIHSFVERKILDGLSGCMYISGVPGTGKTATVHNVIKSLQQSSLEKDLPTFDFVEINALRLTEPRQAYIKIWESLSGKKASLEQSLGHLEKKFSSKPKKSTVIMVDELDYLCNRRQDVVYNILDWPSKTNSKLTVLAIANTMDLPERTLKGKVTSRMGLTRVVFQPYNFKQLQEIVANRLSGSSHFHVDAIQLVSRKVAAVSGDARRALGICRLAIEMLKENEKTVTVDHVSKVLNDIFTGPQVQAIRNASYMQQMVLRAMRDESLRTGVDETTVKDMYPQFVSLCHLEASWVPHITAVLGICRTLAGMGFITAERGGWKGVFMKIALNVSSDDIHYALTPKDD